MEKISQEIYEQIDNTFYDGESANWWQPDSVLNLMKTSVNPVRVGYAKKKLFCELNINPKEKSALEVGCGGGVLTEEVARMGFNTFGIDPSEKSLRVAINHSKLGGLNITYNAGLGEALPYRGRIFDVVFCCDVLEHVRDLSKVISEISRVLKPGGILVYDTLNRTLISKLVVIKISQEWKRWAFMPSNIHVWEMFIKPDELKLLLQENGLGWKEHRGIEPNASILRILGYLRKRAKGKLTYRDIGNKLPLVESSDMSIMYMGYAIKQH
jgi:2-polyprenyl-6-hydroxyphenyl methylase / 3-demethylubiquinone-9 3-methyltransferase